MESKFHNISRGKMFQYPQFVYYWWVQKGHRSWKNWFVSRTLNDKAFELSSICYREILGLSKVESFSNQNKNCTTYWPKIRLLMKNKSISTSYRILTQQHIIAMAVIKFTSNNKSILEKSNRHSGIFEGVWKV